MTFTHLPLGSIVRGRFKRPLCIVGYGYRNRRGEDFDYIARPIPIGSWIVDEKTGETASNYMVDAREIREVLFIGWSDSSWAAFESGLRGPSPASVPTASAASAQHPAPWDPLKKFLPIGSVVDVRSEQGLQRAVIAETSIGRAGITFDYIGYRWPAGAYRAQNGTMDPRCEVLFNARDITRVQAVGYIDDMTETWLRKIPGYAYANGVDLPFVHDCKLFSKPASWWFKNFGWTH